MSSLVQEPDLRATEILSRLGVNHNRGRFLMTEFGSLDNLETVSVSEVLDVRQIGKRTVEKIGIWNDSGAPVKDIPRQPCHECGNPHVGFFDVKEMSELPYEIEDLDYPHMCSRVMYDDKVRLYCHNEPFDSRWYDT